MSTPFPTVKLGHQDVASVILGQSPPSSVYNEVGDGLPFFQGKADFGLLYPMPRVWCRTGQKFASAGDVLISVRAPVGDVNVATDECAIGRGISAIRAGSKMDPWFLYFALLYAKPILESRATGSTFASVNKATLLNLDIPFPDKSQQSKIGVFLHNLVKQIEQETLIIAVAQDLKKAVMQILFTHGLRGEAQKKTEIGPVPESWELCPLETLCKKTDTVDPRREGTRIIEYVDVSSVSREFLTIEATSQSTLQEAPSRARKRIIEGDVIFAIVRPTLLRAACVPAEFNEQVCSTAFCVLRRNPKRAADKFLYYLVQREQFVHQLAGIEHGASYPAVTDRIVKEQIVPVPDLEEQHEIVAIMDAIDRKIDLHRKKRAVLDDLFKAMLHKLMTGEIRVGALNLWALQSNHNSLLKPRGTNGR